MHARNPGLPALLDALAERHIAETADSDGSITQVDFYDGATLVGTATTAPYTVTISNAAAGTHVLTARATDNLGSVTTSAAVSVSVNAAPTVSITSPTNGASFNSPANITITATAADSDGSITQVDFYDGATLVGTATTAPYTATISNAATGTHVLTARATDNLGSVTTSAAVSVSVNAAVAQIYFVHTDHLNRISRVSVTFQCDNRLFVVLRGMLWHGS